MDEIYNCGKGYFQPKNTLHADFAYWAKMKKWKETVAVTLFLGLNPEYIWFNGHVAYAAKQYEAEILGLLSLAIDATHDRHFPYPHTPAVWLDWAKKYDLPMPPELEREISKRWDASGSAGPIDRGPAHQTAETSPAKQCEEWLKDEMEKSPEIKPASMTKPKCWAKAVVMFKGLKRGQFNTAWSNAISAMGATAWAAPGCPQKSIQ